MTKAFPRGCGATARRLSESLDDWLEHVIHEKAKADLRRIDEEEFDDDFEEAPRRFARSRGELDGGYARREREPRAASWRASRPRESEEIDAERIIGDAVELFERRAAEKERKKARTIAGLAEFIESNRSRPRFGDELGSVIDRLGRIESRMARQAETVAGRPIRRALARLESRIERLSRGDRAAELETALEGLELRLAEIAERLDRDATERCAAPARPEREQPPVASTRRPPGSIAEAAERRRAPEERKDVGARPFPIVHTAREPERRTFDDIRNSIETISHRLDSVRHEANDRGAQQSTVAWQVERLRHELEGVSRALVDLAPRASVAAVEAALRDLAERVETQRNFGVRENVLAPVERLTADLQSIIHQLDPSRIVHDLYDEVKTIGDKLAARPVDGGADHVALDDLARQTREIRDLLKAIAARPLPLEKLEASLTVLTRRVEELSLAGQSAARAGGDVGELVEAIRSIVATETGGAFEGFEQKLEGLAAKIDAVLAKSGGGKRFDEINERIDRVHKSLAARIDRGAASVDTSQLEHLVTRLAKKIDTALDPKAAHPAFDELGRKIEKLEERLPPHGESAKPAAAEQFRELTERIDFVHSQLAARIEEGARTRADDSAAQLSELVGELAEKMDAALDPRADRAAFASLEQQINRLSERLDRSDESVASVVSVERRIGELFARIDDARDASARAAELAARQAAQDVLREAAATPGALQGALEKEIANLRNVQDESGQRTQETLAAVHETLERVVDRLAVFEDELANLRKAPSTRLEEYVRRRHEAQAKAAISPPPGFADALLQTGAHRLARRDQGIETGRAHDAEHSVQADFIAAARRAAERAAADARAASQERNGVISLADERPEDDTPQASEARNVGVAIQARRRPLLLSLGALVMLIGAYQIARVGIDAPRPIAPTVRREPGAAVSPGSAPQTQSEVASTDPTTADGPSRPADASGSAMTDAATRADVASLAGPPTAPTTGSAAVEAIDPMPVGSIGPAVTASGPTRDIVATIHDLATAGNAAAQFELAARYTEGRGLARDPKAAFQWFEKAAGQGLAPAQYRLGSLYEKGLGVGRDHALARDWYQRAARAGNARAMHNLAVLYAEAGNGGKPDYAAAADWFQKAAEYGVRDSQFNLAILYTRGLGVGQSLVKSYLWFSAAAAQGDEEAAKRRDEAAARLDSKELAAAKALVDGFKPKQPDRASNDVTLPPAGWESFKAPATPEGKPAGKPKVSTL